MRNNSVEYVNSAITDIFVEYERISSFMGVGFSF